MYVIILIREQVKTQIKCCIRAAFLQGLSALFGKIKTFFMDVVEYINLQKV